MQYTTLKKTDMKISTVGIGTNKVGGHNYYKDLSEEEGKDFIKEAVRLGVNFIDTADVYGLGRSEELNGDVLKTLNRDELIVATKGGVQWDDKGNSEINNSPDYLRSAFEASLKRLQLDYVDLYYLHFPDNKTPLSESLGVLSRLKEEGKIRAIGVSNLSIDQLKEADQITEITALQSGYNMFDRKVEKEILPYCAEHNISFIPYFPLASGLLGGKYKSGDPVPERFEEADFRSKVAKTEKLKAIAERKDITLPVLALSWLLAQDGVEAVIPGGRRPEQVRGIIQASDVVLSQEELSAIETILSES